MLILSNAVQADALTRVDEEIHRQAVFLSSLRTKRNFLLPVSRLPPETLAIIFIHGARDFHERARSGCFIAQTPSWVNVSYVCSHWRNVALNCPVLWTYHFNVSLRWSEELLRRSKQASLKIFCTNLSRHKNVSWWPCLLDYLLKDSERIQELCLHLSPSFLPAELRLRALRLEKLEISLRPGNSERSIIITNKCNHRLHTLKVEGCSLPWSSLNLSGLKILSLRRVRSLSTPNMVEFLAILRSMQNLTVLDLERILPSARDFLLIGGLDDSQKVNLPHLTLLRVVAPLSTVVVLLSCVKIPLKAQLDLRPLAEPWSSVADFDPISSFLAQQFKQASGPIFRSLVFNDGLTFGLEPEPIYFPVDKTPSPLRIVIGEIDHDDSVEDPLSESDNSHIIMNMCGSVPLTSIQSLHVVSPEQFSSDLWREMLGYLDSLRHLELSDGSMPDLSLLSLAACEPKENSDGQLIQDPALDRILVPALEEIVLERIMFGRGDGLMSQESFFRTLSTRKGLRDRVTMVECEVESDGDSSP